MSDSCKGGAPCCQCLMGCWRGGLLAAFKSARHNTAGWWLTYGAGSPLSPGSSFDVPPLGSANRNCYNHWGAVGHVEGGVTF